MLYTLIEQAELRNKLIDRVDVLNKVKELFLIPKLEMMSSQMVADFYEADAVTLRKCYTRNKDEITSDGAITSEYANVPLCRSVWIGEEGRFFLRMRG